MSSEPASKFSVPIRCICTRGCQAPSLCFGPRADSSPQGGHRRFRLIQSIDTDFMTNKRTTLTTLVGSAMQRALLRINNSFRLVGVNLNEIVAAIPPTPLLPRRRSRSSRDYTSSHRIHTAYAHAQRQVIHVLMEGLELCHRWQTLHARTMPSTPVCIINKRYSMPSATSCSRAAALSESIPPCAVRCRALPWQTIDAQTSTQQIDMRALYCIGTPRAIDGRTILHHWCSNYVSLVAQKL